MTTNAQGDLGLTTPQDIMEHLGITFKNPRLLLRALTHRSYLNEHPETLQDNERLEFLGDAVLDFVVGAWLYNHFPEMAEGDLTQMRAALVRTEQLAVFGEELELGPVLRLGHGEEETGGRTRDAMLCAAYEAIVGALYLDSGVVAVENFISRYLEDAADEIFQNQKDQDPKSRLQEYVQSQGHPIPQYKVVAEEGPDHAKTFMVEVHVNGQVAGHGSGASKRRASKIAAQDALKNMSI